MAAKPGPLRPHEERRNYSRRIPATPLPGEPSLGESFLIVTEGEVTEKLYFESVRAALQLTPVTVKVVHPNYTDAVGLVRAAMAMYEKDRDGNRVAKEVVSNRDVAVFDHVWVLFDTDVPDRQGRLGPALELARKENIHIGHSTPSVEIWLLLHFRDRPGPLLNGAAAEHAVGAAWGQHYDKRAETFPTLWAALKPNITAAVGRGAQVREYHKNADTPFPQDPSTQLDLLVRALDASVQPQRRIIRQD
jgi:hypothetical protein